MQGTIRAVFLTGFLRLSRNTIVLHRRPRTVTNQANPNGLEHYTRGVCFSEIHVPICCESTSSTLAFREGRWTRADERDCIASTQN